MKQDVNSICSEVWGRRLSKGQGSKGRVFPQTRDSELCWWLRRPAKGSCFALFTLFSALKSSNDKTKRNVVALIELLQYNTEVRSTRSPQQLSVPPPPPPHYR